jgi:alpha-tubulin suppressor-like RCC1 family protein
MSRRVFLPVAAIVLLWYAMLRVDSVESDPLPFAGGGLHTLFVTDDGDLYAYGSNAYGQLGLGGTIFQSEPAFVMADVALAAAGMYHSLIITTDGRLLCAGRNNYGQLGDGTRISRSSFVEVACPDIVALEEGGNHSLAIVGPKHRLFAWGSNSCGQLGLPMGRKMILKPVDTGIGNVAAVAGGDHHTLILLQDGQVLACGDNSFGQLGNPGYYPNSELPVPVLGLEKEIVAVKAGGEHSILLCADGTLYFFGKGSYGQLCTGKFDHESLPVEVALPLPVLKVDAEGPFTLMLLPDGAWACGFDNHGESGNGKPFANTAVPVAVLAGAGDIGAGHYHAHAIKGHTVYSWGWNEQGQAGGGSGRASRMPWPVKAYSLADF